MKQGHATSIQCNLANLALRTICSKGHFRFMSHFRTKIHCISKTVAAELLLRWQRKAGEKCIFVQFFPFSLLLLFFHGFFFRLYNNLFFHPFFAGNQVAGLQTNTGSHLSLGWHGTKILVLMVLPITLGSSSRSWKIKAATTIIIAYFCVCSDYRK